MINDIERNQEGYVISGICHCGHKVWLGAFTCECGQCGQLYNWAGQEFRPEVDCGELMKEGPR